MSKPKLRWYEIAYLAACIAVFVFLDVVVIVGVNGGLR